MKVHSQRDADGTTYTMLCPKCGRQVTSYVQKGQPYYAGIGDLECSCGAVYNVCGQTIMYPEGQGFDYCGECDDEEDF